MNGLIIINCYYDWIIDFKSHLTQGFFFDGRIEIIKF